MNRIGKTHEIIKFVFNYLMLHLMNILFSQSACHHCCTGVNSFHVFMADVGDQKSLPEADIYQVLRRCKQLGALLTVHAENGCLIEEVMPLNSLENWTFLSRGSRSFPASFVLCACTRNLLHYSLSFLILLFIYLILNACFNLIDLDFVWR